MPGGKRKRAKGAEKKGDKRRRVAANLDESPRHKMIREMREAGHDGEGFASSLETSTKNRARKGKPPKRNRYIHYCEWSYALLRLQIGPPDCTYSFPNAVLTYIRSLVTGDIVGEIREDAYKVTMEDFCRALEIESL